MKTESVQNIFLALLRFAIVKTELSDAQKSLSATDKHMLYELSKAHDLTHLIGDALEKNGLLSDDDVCKKFRQARQMAVCRYEQTNYELGRICNVLEKAKIEYIPLKGAILRRLYPEPWMRTSCDIDVLVKAEQLDAAAQALIERLGYRAAQRGNHDVSLYAPGGLLLELHFRLGDLHITDKGENVLASVWDHVEQGKRGGYCRRLTDDMFYFFHVSHMAKHFEAGGCGVRPFLDLWLLEQQPKADKAARERLLEEGGLATFEKAVKQTAEAWCLGLEQSALVQEIQQYVLRGGVYGSLDNLVMVQRVKKGGKIRYMFSRIFVPFDFLALAYPSLRKHKWLFPFYQVRRWSKLLFKGKMTQSVREINVNANLTKEQKTRAEHLLQALDLYKR